MGQRSMSQSDGHGNIVNAIARKLLKRTEPNTYRSPETNWLRFQGHKVKG